VQFGGLRLPGWRTMLAPVGSFLLLAQSLLREEQHHCKVAIVVVGRLAPPSWLLDETEWTFILVSKEKTDRSLCGDHCYLMDDDASFEAIAPKIASVVLALDSSWDPVSSSARDHAAALARWLRPGGAIAFLDDDDDDDDSPPRRKTIWPRAMEGVGLRVDDANATYAVGRRPGSGGACANAQFLAAGTDAGDELRGGNTQASVYDASYYEDRVLAVRDEGWWNFKTTTRGDEPVAKYFSTYSPHVALLLPESSERVLDVGCGAGLLLKELKETRRIRIGEGIESDRAAALAAARGPRRLDAIYRGRAEDVVPGLPDGAYDAVVLSDVLEHLVEPDLLLRLLAPKLKPGTGRLCVSIPNMRFWTEFLRPLVDGSWDYAPHGVRDRTHLRWYTLDSFLAMARTAGFVADGSPMRVHFGDDHKLPVPLAQALVDVVGPEPVTRLFDESDVRQFLVRLAPLQPSSSESRLASL